ncbi:unnamed protein product [Peronospora belbahrii]|uniref:Uncharacterized protein n=1 Tax=Peronospora belbahrii TaxID=622444 RepID=A0ABN8D8Q7_9STRA|nr:unnamed protein product [Peronospora belbahrii]
MQPEQDAIPSLLMPQGQSAPTGFELEPYRKPPTSFEEDQVVFHTPTNRYRRPRKPVFLLENGTDDEEERKSEGSDGPSSPKRLRIDEEALLVKLFMLTQLSRFLDNPEQQYWSAAIRVLRFLKTTHQHVIIYKGGTSSVTAEAYSDVDWGSNLDDRRSVSGVMIMIGNASVVFKSKFNERLPSAQRKLSIWP